MFVGDHCWGGVKNRESVCGKRWGVKRKSATLDLGGLGLGAGLVGVFVHWC